MTEHYSKEKIFSVFPCKRFFSIHSLVAGVIFKKMMLIKLNENKIYFAVDKQQQQYSVLL